MPPVVIVSPPGQAAAPRALAPLHPLIRPGDGAAPSWVLGQSMLGIDPAADAAPASPPPPDPPPGESVVAPPASE